MLKKSFFLVFAFLLIISSVNLIFAANISYVVKTPSPVNAEETAIISLLEENGHTVTLLDDVLFNPNPYDIIIVGEDVTSISGIFDNKNHKTIFLSPIAAKYAGLGKDGSASSNKITISNTDSIVTEGFILGDLTVYNNIQEIGYITGCKALNSQSLAYKTDNTNSVILLLEKNSLLLNDFKNCASRNVPISERNMFFGLPKASLWNDDAKTLFLNSIEWILYGEDKDEDGYHYDNDCDDNNSYKWQLLEGYVDADKDGYGTGSLLNVCSGYSLPAGYSKIDGDCDDSVASCDTDCVSLNYLDNDGDGYGNLNMPHRACDASSDYVLNSNDCNDSNNEINPDAEEMQYDNIDQNCDNAIEFLSEIPDIEWNEDETKSFNLSSYVWNPGNSELSYYIYKTSKDKYIAFDNPESGIFNFSSDKDWYGEDWIIFGVYEESTDTNLMSNEIILTVNPINDAPRFIGKIKNITFDEDTNRTNYIDLNDYFYDIDEDGLTFDVIGNTFINVILDNGLVSFIPDHDWFGTESIIFSASDGNESMNSNEISITVDDMNEPPEFGLIDCQLDIDEDTEEKCLLNATDFENDSLEFSVVDEDNLDCEIEGNELTYISEKDYNGEANCKIEVDDGNGYEDYVFSVNVLPVNDAPEIKDYNPTGTPKLMENTDNLFSVNSYDVDGDELNIKWFVDGNESGTGEDYVFNNIKGNYEVKAVVSDGEFEDEHAWNVFVGDISDFTCQEVDGYVIKENQVCLGDLLKTSDSNLITCCSIAGQPKFSDVDKCENLSSKLKFNIENPDENDEFIIGDIISGEIKVENDLDEDLDFDVNIYLYDITNDEEIESYEDSVSVNEDESENLEFEFAVPQDLDEKDDYALFVKVIDSDENYCNQDYMPIDIKREKHNVIIQEADIDSEATCGGYFNVKIKVINIGSTDEDVYLSVENSDLNVSEKTEEFKLEKYNEDDTETKTLSIKIPENAEEGNYETEIVANFGDGDNSVTKTLAVECKQIEENISKIEKISLQGSNENAQTNTNTNKNPIVILSIIMLASLIIIILLLNFYLKGGRNDN